MTHPVGKAQRTLRWKVALMVSVAFLAMFLVLFAVFFASMQRFLIAREDDSMRGQARLAQGALLSSVDYLPRVTRDWSSWDVTYQFVEGSQPTFIAMSMQDYFFQLYHINFISVLSTEGSLLFERFYDFRAGQFIDKPPDLSETYAKINPLVINSFASQGRLNPSYASEIGRAGFVIDSGQIYYISAYPILRSDETGPAVGSLIFGRVIDEAEVEFLTADTDERFSLLPLDAIPMTDMQRNELLSTGSLVVTDRNEALACAVVTDLYGESSLVVTLTNPRTLYRQGNAFISVILATILACCLLMLLGIMKLLDRIILLPLKALVNGVNSVNMDTIATARQRSNNREMDSLTDAINGMLGRVKDYRDTIEENNRTLYYQANHDMLTGLHNRPSLTERLRESIRDAQPREEQVCAFYIDLDRFKFINDTLGQAMGDRLIKLLADRLRERLPESVSMGRMGGDEFVVVTDRLPEGQDMRSFARELFAIVREPFTLRQRQVQLEASIGASVYPNDGEDAETLLRSAEIAMFYAKEQGSGLYVPYKEAMQVAMRSRINLENRLKEAVSSGCDAFQLCLQAKENLQTGEIVGCEALIRWATPEGLVSPKTFIPQAESLGLIVPITWWLIRRCCNLGKAFEATGMPLSISINVSAQVLLHDDFLPVVRAAAEETGFDVARLDVEIVEETLLEDIDRVNDVLFALHNLGAQISVDDFGTGYSSLSYLNNISLDRLKIDQSFIAKLGQSPEDQAIVLAIIAMAKTLRLFITAEGVETPEQYAFLQEAGCEEAQGYLISEPLLYDDFMSFLRRRGPGTGKSAAAR